MHTLAQLKSGELHGTKRLCLSENLCHFPLEILNLADSLEILDLSNNQLSSLPQQIKQLSKLKILFASNNAFKTLPEVLDTCPELEMVGFKSNQIAHVPASSLPKKLRWLILTDNQIEDLPEELGERPRLQKLALAGNRLKRLPVSFAKCKNLELLRISANQLSHFPDQLLDLPKLAWLAFSGNPFSQSKRPSQSIPLVSSTSFVLSEVLGQGASGVISLGHWQEEQTEFAADIAVKVFKGEVTSDGYPADELNACLQAGYHPNLVQTLAQIKEDNYLALVMALIPAKFKNLGLPPTFDTCTRDTFANGFSLSEAKINKIVAQMESVFEHLHSKQVCHGDLYAHNTLFDDQANIIFGDFGAASCYHMLSEPQQIKIKAIEKRAFDYFVEDLLSVSERRLAVN